MKKILLILSILTVLCMVGCSNNKVTNNNDIPEEINIEQQEIVETKNELSVEDIKNQLCTEEWILKSAKDNNSEDNFIKYWGTAYRLGGGMWYDENGNFEFTIGVFEDTNPNSGTYTIDTENNTIKYKFINGEEREAKYILDGKEITQVEFIDFHNAFEDGEIIVTCRKKTEDEKKYEKVEKSFFGKAWHPIKAMKNNEEISLDKVYKTDPVANYCFYADATGFYRDKKTIVENEYGDRGFVNIDIENKKLNIQLVSSDISNYKRIDYTTDYKDDENGNIFSFELIENYGTDDEVIVTYVLEDYGLSEGAFLEEWISNNKQSFYTTVEYKYFQDAITLNTDGSFTTEVDKKENSILKGTYIRDDDNVKFIFEDGKEFYARIFAPCTDSGAKIKLSIVYTNNGMLESAYYSTRAII